MSLPPDNLTVLVVGGGGREHALAWKLARSPRVRRVIVAPGNAGTALEPRVENAQVAAEDVPALLELARRESAHLTVVGPEAPLAAGIVDAFADAGLPCFGPRRHAAQLEGSKKFAKEFMVRQGIPTAHHASFNQLDEALRYIRQHGAPVVVKADGLAAGKGVVVAATVSEAEEAASAMLGSRSFGAAGDCIVVEDFLPGEEASFIAMVDGRHILPLATSQDHKARDDGDKGPNTGGMGAYSPAPVVTEAVAARVMKDVMEPVVRGMAEAGCPYTGFLYAGLMIAPDGTPKVLEFNCRFGDPETQPILFRLRSDLVDLVEAALDGRLDQATPDWDPRATVGVVMAAGGYPGRYRQGDVISGLPAGESPDAKVFHAGTRTQDGQVVTSGGRVLCVVGAGDTVAAAQATAYDVVRQIRWDGAFCRKDIGYRAIAREQGTPSSP